jgi:hypothetical protein
MTTRRAFLLTRFLGLAAARLARAADPTLVKSRPDVVVYEGSYPGWP